MADTHHSEVEHQPVRMRPLYRHDNASPTSRYLGTFFNQDVYLENCRGDGGESILVRHGDEVYEYGSENLAALQERLRSAESRIGSSEGWGMSFQAYAVSDRACPYTKACMLALACRP